MLLHDGEELDDDLGRRPDQNLALAGLLSVVHGVEGIVEDGSLDHFGGCGESRFSNRSEREDMRYLFDEAQQNPLSRLRTSQVNLKLCRSGWGVQLQLKSATTSLRAQRVPLPCKRSSSARAGLGNAYHPARLLRPRKETRNRRRTTG